MSTLNDNGDTINQYHLQLQYEDARNYLEMIEKDETEPEKLTSSGEKFPDFAERLTKGEKW